MEDISSINNVRSERQPYPSHDQELTVSETLHVSYDPSPKCIPTLARSVSIVATCAGVMLIHTLNATSAAIALPLIGKDIDIQENQLQWLLSAYSLSSGCPLLLFGRLADLHGRKKAFLIGMVWHMLFALGLGFSRNGITLDILRGFQGMGIAAVIPAALGILAQSFPPSRARSIAFATFAAGSPIGGAFGTIIGGILTQLSKEHWRAPFFLSAGLSAVCVLGALTSFDPDTPSLEADARVDWIGAFLVTSGLVLIVFVLSQGPIAGWETSYIIACLVVGVVLVGIFIVWEYHLEQSDAEPNKGKSFWTPPPLMKLSIWTRASGRMSVVLVIGFLTWSGFISWMFWAQLYYQNVLGLTPVGTMVRFIPMFVMGLLCNLFVGFVVSKLPLVVFIVLGTLVTGSSCVLFALINPSVTYWAFGFPSTIMIVVGADFVYTAGTIFVAKIVFPYEQSLAGGLFQTMTQVGTAFGLTISTIAFNSAAKTQSQLASSAGTNALVLAELQGCRAAQWTNAAFSFLASLLAAAFLRTVGVVGDSKDMKESLPEQSSTSSEPKALEDGQS